MKQILEKIAGFFKTACRWISVDGLLHILVCTVVVVLLSWIKPLWIAPFTALAAGIGKEVYDVARSTKRDRSFYFHCLHDLFCDCIGIALGLFIILAIV